MSEQKRKPRKGTVKVDIRLPTELIAFYEGVAEYTGLTLNDVLNVVLAIDVLKRPQR